MTREKGFYSCYELRPWTVLLNGGAVPPGKFLKSLQVVPGQIKFFLKRQRNQRMNAGFQLSRSNCGGAEAVAAQCQYGSLGSNTKFCWHQRMTTSWASWTVTILCLTEDLTENSQL